MLLGIASTCMVGFFFFLQPYISSYRCKGINTSSSCAVSQIAALNRTQNFCLLQTLAYGTLIHPLPCNSVVSSTTTLFFSFHVVGEGRENKGKGGIKVPPIMVSTDHLGIFLYVLVAPLLFTDT